MSGNKILLDTNAVGAYLDNEKFAKSYLKNNLTIGISVITQIEFLSNPELTTKNKFLFDEFIELVEIYPVARENKILLLQTIAVHKKFKLKLPDAIITATAIVNNATLFNADDIFAKIYNLNLN